MFLDLQTKFSGTTSAAGVNLGDPITATAISSNVLDRLAGNVSGLALEDEGIAGPLFLVVQVTDNAFTAAGAATLTVTLESDTTANLATTPVVHFSSPAIPKATLVLAFQLRWSVPNSDDYKRFLGTRYTVATGPFTAGNLVAYLTNALARNKVYPIGFGVS